MSGFSQEVYALDKCRLKMPTEKAVSALANAFAGIEPWKTLKTDRSRMEKYFIQNPQGVCRRVVVVNSDVAGMVCVKQEWLVGPYLEFLGLLPDFHGLGIGRTIMNWLEEEAAKSKARNLFLCVSSFNTNAVKFYTSLGFVECGKLEELIIDNHDEILMRKRLF